MSYRLTLAEGERADTEWSPPIPDLCEGTVRCVLSSIGAAAEAPREGEGGRDW